MPFVIAFTFYFGLKLLLGFDTPGQTEDSRETVRAALASVDLPPGVTVTSVDYRNDVTNPPTAIVRLDVPVDADLPAVTETVLRAVWLSDVDPLNAIRVEARDRTEAETAATSADPGALPVYWDTGAAQLYFLPEDAPSSTASKAHQVFLDLTDRWGGRPVAG